MIIMVYGVLYAKYRSAPPEEDSVGVCSKE